MAFAIAVALHEIAAGLIPSWAARPRPEPEVVTKINITRIEVKKTPPPPSPPPRVLTHAHAIAVTAPHPIAHTQSAKSAPKEPIRRAGALRPKPPPMHVKPIWDKPMGAQGAGAGHDSGAGSLGNGGNATGAGTAGTGSGAAKGTEPCGSVYFSDTGSQNDPNSRGTLVYVRIVVHLADGSQQSEQLDYPWYYPNDAANPWSDENRSNPDFPTTFQWPPASKRASEPPIVQYVMQHTAPQGYTYLKDCPAQPSNR